MKQKEKQSAVSTVEAKNSVRTQQTYARYNGMRRKTHIS